MQIDYGVTFLFLGLIIASYYYLKNKKRKTVETGKNNFEKVLKEEFERRAKILTKVEAFVKSSKFVEPIAVWKNDNIYKYIFNNGKLYEFEEIMPETNQRIGIDDDYLCFKRFCYKRVANPINFINKFGKMLNIKEDQEPKDGDKDLMLS